MDRVMRSAKNMHRVAIFGFATWVINVFAMELGYVDRDPAFLGTVAIVTAIFFTGAKIIEAIALTSKGE